MTYQQVRLDGKAVSTIYAEIPGFGKVALEWEGTDRPKDGDRIICGDNSYVITGYEVGSKYNNDGVAKDERKLVYKTQGVRHFRYENLVSEEESEAAWRATKAAEGA